MDVQEVDFESRSYLTLRKTITTSQISDKEMYDQAGQKLGAYMEAHGIAPTGPWTVLYFVWDEAVGNAEIGIAFPVHETEVADSELSIVHVPHSKAARGVLHGSYVGLKDAHAALMQYAGEHGLGSKDLPVSAIEEYTVSPSAGVSEQELVTNIYYLHT